MAKKDKKQEEGQEEQEQKKKKGKLKWILLAVVIIVLGVGGYFGYTYYMDSRQNNGNATQEESEGKKEEKPETVTLPSFVVNLADPLGRRYLKVSMDVEVVNKEAAKELEDAMPRVKDSLLLLLSSKSYSEVDSMEEKLQLKKQIVSRLNQIVDNSPVVKVYFTEFVVQ
ncbi:MAG: flagellar basal body-associated protein FliL [Desulfonatronovibrionaceae bacterium]